MFAPAPFFAPTMRGFVAAGQTTGGTSTSVIERFTRLTEVVASIAATTTGAMQHAGCAVRSPQKGYMMGGDDLGGNSITGIDALKFGGETISALAATLSSKKGSNSWAGVNSRAKGFMCGGVVNQTTPSNVIEGLVFATETSGAIGATLASVNSFATGCSSDSAGYLLGGSTTVGGGNPVTTIQRLTFSSEARTTIAATLGTPKSAGACVNSSAKGYFMGGLIVSSPFVQSAIEILNFNNETSAVAAATLDNARFAAAPMSFSDRGYVAGGTVAGFSASSTIENMVWQGESSATISAALAAVRNNCAGLHTPGVP